MRGREPDFPEIDSRVLRSMDAIAEIKDLDLLADVDLAHSHAIGERALQLGRAAQEKLREANAALERLREQVKWERRMRRAEAERRRPARREPASVMQLTLLDEKGA